MDTITIENINLVDDPTPTGGKSFDGETLDDFIKETLGDKDESTIGMKTVNSMLKDCGIEPITEDQIVFRRPLKLYEMEYQAHNFMKGWHSLKEWAEFGFNKVVFEGRSFWDGLENGCDDFEDIEDLEMSYIDFDGDNYMFVGLERGQK